MAGEWRLRHRPALDGLRGVAVLLVVANHAAPGVPSAGQVGVTAFFVLSGFLITALLLGEHARSGAIELGTFYARRALRLAPALIVCVVVVWTLASSAGLTMGPGGAPASLLYLMDFVQAGREHFGSGLMGHTWSLAIEEQFYLVWPIVLLGLLRWRVRLVPALTVVTAVAAMWMLALVELGAPPARVAYGPDSRSSALLAGCALAAYCSSRGVPKMPTWATTVTLPVLIVLAFAASGAAQILLAIPVTVVLICSCLHERATILRSAPLRALGVRSYGLYLWHFPILQLAYLAAPDAAWAVRSAVALTITAAIVEASWRWVESPLLARRPTLVSVTVRQAAS